MPVDTKTGIVGADLVSAFDGFPLSRLYTSPSS